METATRLDTNPQSQQKPQQKKDANYVFYELTRSICPVCRKVIDAKILLRDNKVYMSKRCPDCGPFEGAHLRRRGGLYNLRKVQQARDHSARLLNRNC